jgi:hypothetical protein
MNIHEYLEYLEYFFDTLGGKNGRAGDVNRMLLRRVYAVCCKINRSEKYGNKL